MTWKDILKMPMPMSVAQGRDENFEQKIADFEKRKIEPAFTKYTQGLRAGTPVKLEVKAGADNQSEMVEMMNHAIYYISREDTEKLGGNKDIIHNFIGRLYEKEGYKVTISKDRVAIEGTE